MQATTRGHVAWRVPLAARIREAFAGPVPPAASCAHATWVHAMWYGSSMTARTPKSSPSSSGIRRSFLPLCRSASPRCIFSSRNTPGSDARGEKVMFATAAGREVLLPLISWSPRLLSFRHLYCSTASSTRCGSFSFFPPPPARSPGGAPRHSRSRQGRRCAVSAGRVSVCLDLHRVWHLPAGRCDNE